MLTDSGGAPRGAPLFRVRSDGRCSRRGRVERPPVRGEAKLYRESVPPSYKIRQKFGLGLPPGGATLRRACIVFRVFPLMCQTYGVSAVLSSSWHVLVFIGVFVFIEMVMV